MADQREDLLALSKDELQDRLRERGVAFKDSATKAELVDALSPDAPAPAPSSPADNPPSAGGESFADDHYTVEQLIDHAEVLLDVPGFVARIALAGADAPVLTVADAQALLQAEHARSAVTLDEPEA